MRRSQTRSCVASRPMSRNQEQQQLGRADNREQDARAAGGGRRAVAQVAVAEAHKHLLVLPYGVVAPFLVVRRATLQARALRGRVELLFLGVRVPRLHDLAAPARRARHGLHADARLRADLRHVRVPVINY